jgi:phosphatidylserine decarboxylase
MARSRPPHRTRVIAPEGHRLVAGTTAAATALAILATVVGGWSWLPAAAAFLLAGFTLWFFRDPPRTSPHDTGGLLLAPADGRVIEVVDEHDPLYLKGPARRVSIFLSPLNVHVNRIPCDGVVEYVRYVPGEYLVAWHPKASEKNERSEIGVRTADGVPVLFKQIAGAVARRIVFYPKVGDRVRAGDRFGIVKFGSRMDVLVPPDASIDVTPGQRMVGGETVVGRLPTASERAADGPRSMPAEAGG